MTIAGQITQEILSKQKIVAIQEMNEVNEVGESSLPPCLHVIYESGEEQWIKGEANVKSFVNQLLSAR